MMRNSKEKGCEEEEEAKLEEGITNMSENNGKFSVPKGPSTSSRSQWSGFRNPRIVRVSRSFGGKDRHSKVCTIRGLRDRRIRLSVPTAIQLYDLQDKLKLGQPSKVIDWLLDVTKLDIEKLPPLQIPTAFSHHSSLFHQQMLFPTTTTTTQYDHHHHHHSFSSSSSQFCSSFPPPSPFSLDMKDSNSSTSSLANHQTMGKSKLWDTDLAAMRATVLHEKASSSGTNKGKWIDGSSRNANQQIEDHYNNEQISMSNSNAYNYNNTCDHHNHGVFPSQLVEAAQTSSSSSPSLFFTPYASYITNPFDQSHIHFLSSISHPNLSNNNNNNNINPFMSNSPTLHPFASHNLKPPFPPPNFNLNKHFLHADNNNNNADSGKDGARSGAHGNSQSDCGR